MSESSDQPRRAASADDTNPIAALLTRIEQSHGGGNAEADRAAAASLTDPTTRFAGSSADKPKWP